ncbi:methylmalonyl-CoA carboxyltransferase [Rhodospirillum rubrum]|uniref:acyl-CoA carboxylase subunit beta n=1 Tax=Rhodospirillum rubrum TaxID=1085 RepID=UPI001908D66A|nr:acyl-CoA carboxylase subunit beta [Rhodospirillum rubrum]MBK1666251.1 methylmalonyl-CoA carboxyltransferase [Rhodospirillum rubrum]MBK1676494.1 methylmalonyl-CoA carboxyltransferase [Rhodospirillum rubrum]
MAISKTLVDELEKRRAIALEGGGADKAAARHAKGRLTARERLMALYSPGTFQEFGLHALHNTRHFGMENKPIPADGVIVGTGFVDGRPVAGFSQDFTVAGGSLGEIHARKICHTLDHAVKAGIPVVGFQDSGGARIQEGVGALSAYGQVFYRNVQLSGVVPQIAVIAGPCAGGAAYSPALMDFVIMTRENAQMFICGPEVIRAVTGQHTTVDEIGSAQVHASVSGNIHFIAESDDHAVAIAHRLLSFLPSNNMSDPPHTIEPDLSVDDDPGFDDLLPADSKTPFDVREVILRLSDGGDFMEVMADFAANIVIGFGRIGGVVVGYVANQPLVKAGTLDIDASDKAARFVRFCNIFNIPLVTLVDVPGFLPGVMEERRGIIRHGAKMLFAYASATVPKITVILRKAYGGAYLAMCSQDMGADRVLAWPSAEIAVMGAEGAVSILYNKELAQAEDRQARARELADDYRAEFASPYLSAGMLFVSDIIQPRQTRSAVALTLRGLLSKRETRPPKKHGNIPL